MSQAGNSNRGLHASLRTALDVLPGLSHDARTRIREAVQTAIRHLKDISEIWHPLSSIRDGDHAGFLRRWRQSERAYLRVIVDARKQVFNAIAIEYSRVDQDPENRFERLEQIATPFVEQVLPLSHGYYEFLRSALSIWAFDWSPTQGMRWPMDSRETPAELIDRLRAKKSLSMEALANSAGVGVAQVYKVKKGEDVNVRTIRSVAAVLGCSPGDLILPIPVQKKRAGRQNSDLLVEKERSTIRKGQ